jgi:hypothetical protein
MTYRDYPTLPPIPTGYPLYARCPFGVIVPYARRNIVLNPSLETNTTGYTAVGSSIARTTTEQHHGAYSLGITPTAATTDGAYYGTVSLTSGITYAVSCKVKGMAGRPYKFSAATTGGVDLTSYRFVATGRWQWIWLFWTEVSTTTRRIYLVKDNDANTGVFYWDGLQVEACGSEGVFVTTYIDGDQQGLVPNQSPPAYFWEGAPHASFSQRSGQTRAGGRVISFARFGFILTAIIGLGLVPPQHIANQYAQLDGANYDRTRKPPRQFTLSGRLNDADEFQLARQRGDFQDLFDRDLIAEQQPLMLCYQLVDCYDERVPLSGSALIPALYAGGLDGNTNNLFAEEAATTFTQYLPFILGGTGRGASLTVQQSVASNNRAIQRSPAGLWSNLGTGFANGAINAMATGKDGRIYFGGTFTVAGGSVGNRAAYWDPVTQTLNAMSTGLDNIVRALAVAPNGDIIAAGSFTGKVSRWNGSAWSTVGTVPGTTPIVYGLAVDSIGNIYAVGTDTGANLPWAAVYNGASWTQFVTSGSATAIINTVTIGLDGTTVHMGGDFLSLNGVASLNRVATWNGSVISAMSSGMNSVVYDMDVGPNGIVYAVGFFTTASGNSAIGVAQWNGTIWTNVGSGVSLAQTIRVDQHTGRLYAASAVTPYQFVGAAWVQLDVTIPGSPANFIRLAIGNDTTLYLGYDTTGTAVTGAITTISNPGTARSYPTLTITGPSSGTARIWQIVNTTTNRAIYFNYIINAGETATFIFDPANLSFTSDFQGNIAGTILSGSNEADFFIQPDNNVLSFFAAASTVTATLQWRPAYASLDDLRIAP